MALCLLWTMQRRRIQPDCISFHAVAETLLGYSRWACTLLLLSEMNMSAPSSLRLHMLSFESCIVAQAWQHAHCSLAPLSGRTRWRGLVKDSTAMLDDAQPHRITDACGLLAMHGVGRADV